MTALVVGGGPAGASFAVRLARAGERVVLFERDAGPSHKVCGEFLSHEALRYLTKIGIDLDAAGAVPLSAVRLATPIGTTTVPLPFHAASLSRHALDELLLAVAAREGVDVRRGQKAREAHAGPSSARVRLEGGDAHEGDVLVMATGKHDLRGHVRPAGLQSDLVAFKMHYRLAPAQARALEGHVELATFAHGYAGLQPVEGGFANLCLLVEKQRLAAIAGGWGGLVGALGAESGHLRERLAGAVPRWRRPLGLSRIPYGYVRGARHDDGAWHLGDRAAVIPSFAGDGMAMALHGAELAANAFVGGVPRAAYAARFAADVRAQVVLGTGLSKVAVTPWGQRLVGAFATLFPFAVSMTASLTRISDASLRRASWGAA